jgi:hypothetical protein
MPHHPPLDDDAIEATLTGRAPVGRPDLAALATFVDEVRTTFEQQPAPRVGPELARLFEGCLRSAEKAGNPCAEGASGLRDTSSV